MNASPSIVRRLLLLMALLAAPACTTPTTAPALDTPATATATTTTAATDAALWARAESLAAQAAIVEPEVTPRLLALAKETGGVNVGLRHRFKTLESIHRKLQGEHADEPGTPPSELQIGDALRYTINRTDDPPGAYRAAVNHVLDALEADGYVVLGVRNYWPPVDGYSGINCTLATADGFRWELQFHTPMSDATRHETHEPYEAYRDPDTTEAERRRLFEEMTAMWVAVPIPQGALDEAQMRAQEEVRVDPRSHDN